MTKRASSPKQTSGGGFTFEDQVVAYFLTHLFTGHPPFEIPKGQLKRVETQKPANLWHLDDLLLTIQSNRDNDSKVAFSIKSNQQFNTNGFPDDFIKSSWKQLLNISSSKFDPRDDYLGLITAPIDSSYKEDVYTLLQLSRSHEASELAEELQIKGRVNNRIRTLFQSCKCPDEFVKENNSENKEAGKILKKIVWFPLDFQEDHSTHEKEALSLLQNTLNNGDLTEVHQLWDRLVRIANSLRTNAGSLERFELLEKLKYDFELKDFPVYKSDWEKLEENTTSSLKYVASKIGGKVELPRQNALESLAEKFQKTNAVVLIGASGSGKSVIAKKAVQSNQFGNRSLWFEAERLQVESLFELRNKFDLSHSISELLASNPEPGSLIVIDGIEKLYNDREFGVVAELIQALDLNTNSWRLLFTCQPEAWERVRKKLIKFDAWPDSIEQIPVGNPTPDELNKVWEKFPQLESLKNKYHLSPILLRPKVLDILTTKIEVKSSKIEKVTESDLINWFWSEEITGKRHGISRESLAISLAIIQADKLLSAIPSGILTQHGLSVSDLKYLDVLAKDRIVDTRNGVISFEHDLYRDWALTKKIVSEYQGGDLTSFLENRSDSPIWNRAIRLFGIYLLEQEGVDQWQQVFDSFNTNDSFKSTIIKDSLLEATCFASNPLSIINNVWDKLISEDGKLLNRLLKNLIHSATIPNSVLLENIKEIDPSIETYLASETRIPYWPYFITIINFLYLKKEELPNNSHGYVAKIVTMWLKHTSTSWPLRDKAAAIAIYIGDELLRFKETNNNLFYSVGEYDKNIYAAVLASANEYPAEATQILLEAAGRKEFRFLPTTDKSESKKEENKRQPLPFASVNHRKKRDPWPHGPSRRVDESLKSVTLETNALEPFIKARPKVASELLLALLIEESKTQRDYRNDMHHNVHRLSYLKNNFFPPFYIRGPFLSFLRIDPHNGIDTILKLINHAIHRWTHRTKLREASSQNKPLDEVKPPSIELIFNDKTKEYIGIGNTFGWHIQNEDSYGVLTSSLMALEKFFYEQLEGGKKIEKYIDQIFNHSKSIAPLGVLASVGKKQPTLFCGPLKPLLTNPLIYSWDNSISNWPTNLLNTSFDLLSSYLKDDFKKWSNLEHRKIYISQIGQALFLNTNRLDQFYNDITTHWKNLYDDPDSDFHNWDLVQTLIARFRKENYEIEETQDGQQFWKFNPPEEIQKKADQKLKQSSERLNLQFLPMRCRKWLDGDEPIEENDLEQAWKFKQKLNEDHTFRENDIHEITSPTDILAGIAAVIINQKGELVKNESERFKWAKSFVIELSKFIRNKNHGDVSTGELDHNYSAFCSDALALLWLDNKEDKVLREAIAGLIFSCSPDDIKRLINRIFKYRKPLGDDYNRLLRMILLRSQWENEARDLRMKLRHAERSDNSNEEELEQARKKLNEYSSEIEQQFIQGTLPVEIPIIENLLNDV